MKTSLALTTVCCLTLSGGDVLAGGDSVAGKEKSTACQACHGEDGNSPDGQFPRLAGQHSDYIVVSLENYQSGARKNAIMAGFAGPLTAQDREDLAAFYSSQDSELEVIQYTR
jgi:cytochrome c553